MANGLSVSDRLILFGSALQNPLAAARFLQDRDRARATALEAREFQREKARQAALLEALKRTPKSGLNRGFLEREYERMIGRPGIAQSIVPKPEQFTLGRTRFESVPGAGSARAIAEVPRDQPIDPEQIRIAAYKARLRLRVQQGTAKPEEIFELEELNKQQQAPSTLAERRRNQLIDLRLRKERGEDFGRREELELAELEREQEKATAIVGRTPEDVAVKDPVRRRRLEIFVEKNAEVRDLIDGIVKDIKNMPTAVGGVGAARETLGGLVGQAADFLSSESIAEVADKISPEQLTRIRTSGALLRTSLLPFMTGDESRYTDQDLNITTENIRILETTSSADQALAALSVIRVVVGRRDKSVRKELLEGFNKSYLDTRDIERHGFQKGNIYSSEDGSRAEYLDVVPDSPYDARNWREIKE